MSEVDPVVRQGEAHFQARVKDLIITARMKDLIITARVKDLITSDRACPRCIHEKDDAQHARGVSTRRVLQRVQSMHKLGLHFYIRLECGEESWSISFQESRYFRRRSCREKGTDAQCLATVFHGLLSVPNHPLLLALIAHLFMGIT